MLVINSVPASGDTADMELPPLKFHLASRQAMMSNFDHRVEIWFALLDRVICRHRIVRVRGLAKRTATCIRGQALCASIGARDRVWFPIANSKGSAESGRASSGRES